MNRFLSLWFPVLAVLSLGTGSSFGAPAPEAFSATASSPAVHSIQITGNTVFSSEELLKRMSLSPGKPFDKNQLRFSAGTLEGFYRDHGYADVGVSTSVARLENHQVDCFFTIHEGGIYHVNLVNVEGNRLISNEIIKRQMQINPGDPFSQARIYEATKQLFIAGYFETIDISYSTASAHTMDVLAKVKERPTQYVKGGIGYGAETKERVSFGYEDKNFFGHMRRFDVLGVYSGFATDPNKYQTTLLETSLSQPYLFNSTYEGKTTITQEWDKRESYYTTNTIWRSTVGKHFGKSITANLQYRYQGIHVTHINLQEAATTPEFTNISAIGPNFTYDNTNDVFLPFYGWRIGGSLEKGLTWGVGNLDFYKMTARVGRFETFYGTTLFAGLQGGFERLSNPTDTMPIFERFFLGGANSVRGYEERELGGKDVQGAPLGGEAFAVMNLELRHRLYKKIFGVTFLDSGQLWERSSGSAWPYIRAHSLNDLAYGTGVGLRFHTPVGAVRLELGYKLNPTGEGSPSFFRRTALHFSLGEVF